MFYNPPAVVYNLSVLNGLSVGGDMVLYGSIFQQESVTHKTTVAGFGQFWTLTGAPCVAQYTDDGDTDHALY